MFVSLNKIKNNPSNLYYALRFIDRMSVVYSRVIMIDVYTNGIALCVILFSLSVVINVVSVCYE